jgi:hypothetical protein
MKKSVTASFTLAGIVLVGLFLSFVSFPARRSAYVDSAIGSLRILNNGLHEYAVAHPLQGFPKTLQDLHTGGLIDATLARGVKNHYQFIYLSEIPSAKGSIDRYQIHAQPTDDGKGLYFFTDQSGIIRYAEDAPANQLSSGL